LRRRAARRTIAALKTLNPGSILIGHAVRRAVARLVHRGVAHRGRGAPRRAVVYFTVLLDGGGGGGGGGAVATQAATGAWKRLQSLLMQLRKCCNHPYLFEVSLACRSRAASSRSLLF